MKIRHTNMHHTERERETYPDAINILVKIFQMSFTSLAKATLSSIAQKKLPKGEKKKLMEKPK